MHLVAAGHRCAAWCLNLASVDNWLSVWSDHGRAEATCSCLLVVPGRELKLSEVTLRLVQVCCSTWLSLVGKEVLWQHFGDLLPVDRRQVVLGLRVGLSRDLVVRQNRVLVPAGEVCRRRGNKLLRVAVLLLMLRCLTVEALLSRILTLSVQILNVAIDVGSLLLYVIVVC